MARTQAGRAAAAGRDRLGLRQVAVLGAEGVDAGAGLSVEEPVQAARLRKHGPHNPPAPAVLPGPARWGPLRREVLEARGARRARRRLAVEVDRGARAVAVEGAAGGHVEQERRAPAGTARDEADEAAAPAELPGRKLVALLVDLEPLRAEVLQGRAAEHLQHAVGRCDGKRLAGWGGRCC